jgi:hydroxymethylglutaryl-CoA lyase
MNVKPDIVLVDVSARDGLQSEAGAAALSAEIKAAFIRKLAEAGLTRIEAGSFVRPQAVPAMANSAEVAALLAPVQQEFPNVVFSYLVPNIKGIERATTAQAKEVAIFLALSDSFSRANINIGVDESYRAIEPVIEEALANDMRVRGYISTVFGYSDLPFSPGEVARRAGQLLDMGCFEISLGDTTGIGKAGMVDEIIASVVAQNISLSKIAMHFHDTFGNAIQNVERSYASGIRVFDAATGGLGGCPSANSPRGNLAMEDLVAWCHRKKLNCGVDDVQKLRSAAEFMREKLNNQPGRQA